MSYSVFMCGECGSRKLVIRAFWNADLGEYEWRILCYNGHRWVPTPGTEIIFEGSDGREVDYLRCVGGD